MINSNLRTHGKPPYLICVVHGGPGVAGEMAPVATRLASTLGVLEPFQTADSVEGQIEELCCIIEESGILPVALIGYSWGAWLSWMTAARYPNLVKKLILVSSGPFEEKYSTGIQNMRMKRLNSQGRSEVVSLLKAIDESNESDTTDLFARFGTLMSKADTFDPIPEQKDINCRFDIFQKVWPAASQMRASGELIALAKYIQCPVTAIHGDYDPHPAEGVRESLSKLLTEFRFILLEKCGHKPWVEKQVRDQFFEILLQEINN
ncbi:alpha/beta hydrolase [candidate division KSB1 bacterium]|nr:alpha/beta hydrolase [candidate division KSB1 bacterium]